MSRASDTDEEYELIKSKLNEFETMLETDLEDVEGEAYLDDINIASSLTIDETSELKELGCIYSIVDEILIVQSTFPEILEPGTLTALPNRTPLGIIGDTFGPIESPFYSIKLIESSSVISSLVPGLPVFFCPLSSKSYLAKEFESSESESEGEK